MKFKLILTATVEYEVDPENYQENATPEEMLSIDIINGEDQPFDYLRWDNNVKWDIKGEIVEK